MEFISQGSGVIEETTVLVGEQEIGDSHTTNHLTIRRKKTTKSWSLLRINNKHIMQVDLLIKFFILKCNFAHNVYLFELSFT